MLTIFAMFRSYLLLKVSALCTVVAKFTFLLSVRYMHMILSSRVYNNTVYVYMVAKYITTLIASRCLILGS